MAETSQVLQGHGRQCGATGVMKNGLIFEENLHLTQNILHLSGWNTLTLNMTLKLFSPVFFNMCLSGLEIHFGRSLIIFSDESLAQQ